MRRTHNLQTKREESLLLCKRNSLNICCTFYWWTLYLLILRLKWSIILMLWNKIMIFHSTLTFGLGSSPIPFKKVHDLILKSYACSLRRWDLNPANLVFSFSGGDCLPRAYKLLTVIERLPIFGRSEKILQARKTQVSERFRSFHPLLEIATILIW